VKPYRVCVVDDDEENAALLSEGLKLHGYEAVPCFRGTEALALCARGNVDLVLLDVCLPDIDGYEVCRRLKEAPETRDITVIFVTVKGAREDISRGYGVGAVDYIQKPYNLPMIMVRVDAAMRGEAMKRLSNQSDDELTDSIYTDPLTGLRNRRYLLERLEEEVEKAHRYNYPVACCVFDIDEVSAIDEDLGPVSLDDLLVEVAMAMRNHSRMFDVLARYDGTVFSAVLPHISIQEAINYADRILEELDSTTFSDPSFPTAATLRAGIVGCRNGSAKGADYVLGEAMRSLLQAKSLAGKRVIARNLADG
jgi:diguanylate cyclase (GGDEF)-like protein